MTSRKLSESDKQEMLQLYRQPGETTSTLASRYGVSNSTISRILKSSFTEAEYETLIQQKRGGRSAEASPPAALPELLAIMAIDPPTFEEPAFSSVSDSISENAVDVVNIAESRSVNAIDPDAIDSDLPANAIELDAPERSETATADELSVAATTAIDASPLPSPANGRRLRKRSSVSEPTPTIAPPTIRAKLSERVVPATSASGDMNALEDMSASEDASPLEAAITGADEAALAAKGSLDLDDVDRATNAAEVVIGEALLADEADLASDLEEDDLDDDLDDDLEDDLEDDDLDDGLEHGTLLVGSRIAGKVLVQVLPLAAASLPRTCYLVVDRAAELIARPLKEFGDLGQIPEAEILSKTLPVFDNHRIAKRYSNPRTQRVIKLPDGQVLHKTSSHLQAKGITRLLIDGQVYAL